MKKREIALPLIFIIGTELVGILSGLLSGNIGNIYRDLNQPPFSPPGWIFPLVWVILYALMGWSAYLIYRSGADSSQKHTALIVYSIQLLLNFAWSILFFRFELFGIALLEIGCLLLMVGLMVCVFHKIRPAAGWINLPYLFWVMFAAYLNAGVFVLNR